MHQPLAEKLRPKTIQQFIGQQHLLAQGNPLRVSIELGKLHSMILWGPPGTGKTTLARLLAEKTQAKFEMISPITHGVRDIREMLDKAKKYLAQGGSTIFFADEVHRFNKAQQDIFLPHIENGTIIFIGATTENPSFSLNNALLSRARVYVLKLLTETDLLQVIEQAMPTISLLFPVEHRILLAKAADGDARRCLNLLDIAVQLATSVASNIIDETVLASVLTDNIRRFDKQGEDFYDHISALHKSIRGSCPDAALYWLARMLDGGCNPHYLLRRIVRIASEDIGNADPRALDIAVSACDAYDRLGSPEGDLAIAQAVVYLSIAAKSNAVYMAFEQVKNDVITHQSLPVPLHLRNAPTELMKQLNYGKQYRYPHAEPHAYAAAENYMPDALVNQQYYHPTDRGLELKIREKLDFLHQLDKK